MEKIVGPKIPTVLGAVARHLNAQDIPYALIGAMALGLYGFPRYTSDIDLITDSRSWPAILKIMNELGYECFQKTDAFAQFDSEMGILGKVDFLFVRSEDGLAILDRRVVVEDDLLGNQPVVQPTDYLVLKLMAVANNPDRAISDEADIAVFLKLHSKQMVPEIFEPLDVERLNLFAVRFGQEDIVQKHFIKRSK
jgi:hypothetical protein